MSVGNENTWMHMMTNSPGAVSGYSTGEMLTNVTPVLGVSFYCVSDQCDKKDTDLSFTTGSSTFGKQEGPLWAELQCVHCKSTYLVHWDEVSVLSVRRIHTLAEGEQPS